MTTLAEPVALINTPLMMHSCSVSL